MFGAIIGDVIGSTYEWHNTKEYEFQLFTKNSRFTDDTVTTVAIADAILYNSSIPEGIINKTKRRKTYICKLKEYGHKYPAAGYGAMFKQWLNSDTTASYNSFGNGSAMRVSPIGFAFDTLEKTLKEAEISAAVTHNHKEGIKGAKAVAACIYLSRIGETKVKIKSYIKDNYGYNLDQRLDDIRKTYKFDSSCQGSVPQAIIAFLESDNFEDVIRKAVSIGGDSDTIACIAGGIAQAYYKKIPIEIVNKTNFVLDMGLKNVIKRFNETYNISY